MRAKCCLSIAVALTASILAGCGDDEPSTPAVVGTYEVSGHTLAEGDCGAPQAVADPANCFGCAVEKPFFKLKMASLFGQRYMRLVECDSATLCDDADEDPNTLQLGGVMFDKPVGGVWTGEMHAASGYDTTCTYSSGLYQVDETEAGVRITITRSTASPTVANSEECLGLADNPPPRDTLVCSSVEVIDGTTTAP